MEINDGPGVNLTAPYEDDGLRVLFVGDPNLGDQGERIVLGRLPDAVCLRWDRLCPSGSDNVRAMIRAETWDVCLSFYSDLIFTEQELERMRIALNIPPALPSLPGVGYDELPLIERHRCAGATLHHMVARVDAGPVIDVVSAEIPDGCTRTKLRRLNQVLCLDLLQRIVHLLGQEASVTRARDELDAMTRRCKQLWTGTYLSREGLRKVLESVRRSDPRHPVFR